MIEETSSHPVPRARPIADLPLEELTGRAQELARAWAVALIVSRPAGAIAGIPLEDLARDAPRLCAQMLRALESDAELERLTEPPRDPAREEPPAAKMLAGLAGAGDVASVLAAMEALRGVLWEALLGELRRPVFDRSDAHLLADLADRLAYVCASALAAALGGSPAGDPRPLDSSRVIVTAADSAPPGPGDEPVGPIGRHGPGEVVIVDERPHAQSPARVVAREGTPDASTSPPPPEDPARARADAGWDPPTAEIEIRDERVEEGPAAWIRSIGRELERFAQDARPFTVLLIELMDAERLNRTELPEEVLRLAARVERTLESELRTISQQAPGSLTREAPGRFWLLAPQIGVLRAGALADQVAHAVRRSVSHRGLPVEIAVGAAVCPDHGLQASALAAHADVALYAARAGGSAGYGPAR